MKRLIIILAHMLDGFSGLKPQAESYSLFFRAMKYAKFANSPYLRAISNVPIYGSHPLLVGGGAKTA